jgi:hypothetical protein
MGTRRGPVLASVAVLRALLPASAPATTGPARACHAGRLMTAGSEVRVVRYRGAVYSCWHAGRPLLLSYDSKDAAGGQLLFRPRVAGRFVAFNQVTFSSSGYVYLVEVVDVRTRRWIRAVPTGATAPDDDVPPGSTGVGQTTQIVLRPDGSVAWIARDDFQVPGTAQRYQLWQAQVHHHPTIVAEGTEVDPRSLAATGHQLYWTSAGLPYAIPFS